MAKAYLGGEIKVKDDSLTGSLTPGELQALVGTYRNPKTAETLRVTMRNGKLRIDFEGVPLGLRALGPKDFEPVEYVFEVKFKFEKGGENGEPRKVIVNREMEFPATFEAAEEVKPTVAELAAYAGEYWSDELHVTYRLALKNGALWLKDLIGGDGLGHAGIIPFNELRPVVRDEFDLTGAPLVFRFTRNNGNVTGFVLNGFRERGMVFTRVSRTGP